ncbi:hypothetical protein O181_100437 [Austropuccinia psidii MF-1]|uniref:Uncharacterized protein n=1 Tax=Austropuccinia psidii MF-1 TaxID=1389203 RepID=A0A9Q3PHI6_9BASI|nr:hypothetical protein [Austropuccinia psidii MF-1]
MSKNHLRTQTGHKSVHVLWNTSEAIISAPSKDSPPVQGNTSLPSMHSVLKNQECTKSITNFEGELLSYSVRKCPDGYQKTIQGAQPPGPAVFGLSILTRTILRAILRGYQSFQSLSSHQVLIIPWTTQLVHTGSNQASCMALAQLGQFIFHCGNSVAQFNSPIGQIQTITPDD